MGRDTYIRGCEEASIEKVHGDDRLTGCDRTFGFEDVAFALWLMLSDGRKDNTHKLTLDMYRRNVAGGRTSYSVGISDLSNTDTVRPIPGCTLPSQMSSRISPRQGMLP